MKKSNNYFHHDEHHHGEHHHENGHHGGSGHHKNKTGGGFGPKGICTCMKCGFEQPHQRGVKCTTLKCPDCGHVLARQELVDKRKDQKKNKEK